VLISDENKYQTNKAMRPLPQKLRRNGFNYTLICRGRRSFIYAQHVTPSVTYYEVFRLKISSPKTIMMDGKKIVIEAAERFPTNESFGVWAWSIRGLDKAMEKFKELENELDSCVEIHMSHKTNQLDKIN
jgi:hypothetical protein